MQSVCVWGGGAGLSALGGRVCVLGVSVREMGYVHMAWVCGCRWCRRFFVCCGKGRGRTWE